MDPSYPMCLMYSIFYYMCVILKEIVGKYMGHLGNRKMRLLKNLIMRNLFCVRLLVWFHHMFKTVQPEFIIIVWTYVCKNPYTMDACFPASLYTRVIIAY